MKKLITTLGKVAYVARLTNVKNKKIRILISVLLANLIVAIDVVIIILFSALLTDNVNYENKIVKIFLDLLLDNLIFLPLIIFLRFAFMFIEKLNIEVLSLRVQENLRLRMMKEMYSKGNYSISDAYLYVNTVSMHVSSFFKTISVFLNSLLQVIGYSVFLVYSDVNIVISILIGLLILYFPTKYLLKKGKYYQHEKFTLQQEVNSYVQRIVDNLFLIKILKTKEKEFDSFSKILSQERISSIRNNVYGSLNSIIPSFSALFTLSIVIVFSSVTETLTLEFIGVLLRLFQSLGSFNNTLNLVVNASVHVEELYKLEENKSIPSQEGYKVEESQEKSIIIENLEFKYFGSENSIFKNLNIEIQKNSHTVLTGPNGSGKSTLLGLISGLYIPTIGRIKASSSKLGYVGVTPLIISGSLKENLQYGNYKEISDEKLINIVTEFKLFSDINEIDLDKDIDSKSLSSGQMQKISFMRALLNDVEILLLDESTSNLDKETKELIFNVLKKENLTIINSTHNKDEFDYDYHLKIEYENEQRKLTFS